MDDAERDPRTFDLYGCLVIFVLFMVITIVFVIVLEPTRHLKESTDVNELSGGKFINYNTYSYVPNKSEYSQPDYSSY